jgi:hypothetical protein
VSEHGIAWDILAKDLVRHMEMRRFSYRELAKELGTSPATLNRVGRGKPCSVRVYLDVVGWLGYGPNLYASLADRQSSARAAGIELREVAG